MTTEPNQAPEGVAPSSARGADDEISLWEVLAVLLRRRGTIVASVVLTVALAVTYTLVRSETFTTQASFRPQGSEASSSQLMALAGQFGVNIPGLGSGEELSPAFYAELLSSREILHRVASRTFEVAGEGVVSLPDLLEIDEDTEDLRVEEAVEQLREDLVTVQTGRETGIVTVEVQSDWPDLSLEIAERLLEAIAIFNLDTRQSNAAAERAFIEERVDSARHALLAAEGELQAFLDANRGWEESSQLQFQEARIQRDISLRQQVYSGLVQALEEARISEVRDTPVITVLQAPFLPPGPDDRPLLLAIALGIVLGGMGGIVLAFVVEAVKRPSPGDPAREDFQRAWDSLLGSLPFVGARRA